MTATVIPIRKAGILPLTPSELVTNDTLRELAAEYPERQRGEISEEHQMTLAMLLPDICGELLAYRLADKGEPS